MGNKPGRPPKYESEEERREAYNKYHADYQRSRRLEEKLIDPKIRTRTTRDGRSIHYPITPPSGNEYQSAELEVQVRPSFQSYQEVESSIDNLLRDASMLENGKDIKMFLDKKLPRIFAFDGNIHIILHYPTYYRNIIDNRRDDGVIMRMGVKDGNNQEVQSYVLDRESLLFDADTQKSFKDIIGGIVE